MVELADIFRQYGAAYREKFAERMPPSHLAAMTDIEQCRTEALGGHVYVCPDCDETCYRYHSCRNRHCPKCQHDAAQRWLDQQHALLLPVPYFLLTFTLPEGLRSVARSNQKRIYNLLFQASAAATQQLAQDPRFIGGSIGMIGVLHTWTRDLNYHPHVHCLVPGGGLAPDGRAWRQAHEDFLLPVRALSILFRAKFRDALRQTDLFQRVPPEVWHQDWVVHCQPVGDGATALKYLAPYIFRVAISNRRILSLERSQVGFAYTDAQTGQRKTCTVSVEEFIRRFLQHVLPKGFCKVRYYGFFGPAKRKTLSQVRELLCAKAILSQPQLSSPSAPQAAEQPRCPTCGRIMTLRSILRPRSRCPPNPAQP